MAVQMESREIYVYEDMRIFSHKPTLWEFERRVVNGTPSAGFTDAYSSHPMCAI